MTGGVLVEGVERVVVLRANALGDYLVAVPAIEALRRAYPDASVTLIGTPWHAAFLAGRPGPVDDVVALPLVTGLSTQKSGHLLPVGLLERLRERRFDLAVQIHGGGRHSNPFVRSLGARVTAGLRTPDAEPLDRNVPYLYFQHETLRFLEVAALVGATTADLEPRITVTGADRAELAAALGEPPPGLVAVHPGASDPRRRWPADRFAAVADRLGRPTAVTGTPAEKDLVTETVAAMRTPATPVLDLSVGGLAALYERCALLISNDTGSRHLAAAVGTPTVGIYWCGNLINAGPLTRADHRPLISWTTRCPTCGVSGVDVTADRCEHDPSWVSDIPVEAVLTQATDLLGR